MRFSTLRKLRKKFLLYWFLWIALITMMTLIDLFIEMAKTGKTFLKIFVVIVGGGLVLALFTKILPEIKMFLEKQFDIK